MPMPWILLRDVVFRTLHCMASALLGFCAVTLAHTACIVAYRVMRVLRGFPVTGFSKSRAESENSLYGRICASHANCLENLPCVVAPFLPLDRISDTFCSVFATLVLTNKASAHIHSHSHCHTVTRMLSTHAVAMAGFRRPECDCTSRLHLDVSPWTSARALRQRERSGSECALRILCCATVLHDADRCADVFTVALIACCSCLRRSDKEMKVNSLHAAAAPDIYAITRAAHYSGTKVAKRADTNSTIAMYLELPVTLLRHNVKCSSFIARLEVAWVDPVTRRALILHEYLGSWGWGPLLLL